MRPRLGLRPDLDVDGACAADAEPQAAEMEEELTRYASATSVRARPDLVARIDARVAREPGGPAPRRFFAAVMSLDPRAIVQAFRMTLVVAFGDIGVPDALRAQALLVVLLVTSVVYTGALGTAGFVAGIADATRPAAGRYQQPGGPPDDQVIVDGTVFSSETGGRLEWLPTFEPEPPSVRPVDGSRSNALGSGVGRAPSDAIRPSGPQRRVAPGRGSAGPQKRDPQKGDPQKGDPQKDGPEHGGPGNGAPSRGPAGIRRLGPPEGTPPRGPTKVERSASRDDGPAGDRGKAPRR